MELDSNQEPLATQLERALFGDLDSSKECTSRKTIFVEIWKRKNSRKVSDSKDKTFKAGTDSPTRNQS
jgi:hypothetical protein